jgi:hypothetical protein
MNTEINNTWAAKRGIDNNKKLLTQIKKSKDTKQYVQKLEQENQDLGKKLSEKDEETSHLKILNQRLLEQIRS